VFESRWSPSFFALLADMTLRALQRGSQLTMHARAERLSIFGSTDD
jgi:hypothetical protein